MSEALETKTSETIRSDDAWAAVQTGLHYVAWMARDFLYTGVAREDLEAEGRLGLFEAALRFDPSHGAQFLTYASFWSRRRMQAFIARHAHVVRRPASRVRKTRDHDDVSLDQPVGVGSALSWADILADRRYPRAIDAMLGAEDAALIAIAARELPPQWRKIIVSRFGLDGGPALTLAAVGQLLGLSRERVRQIEQKAMARLRARLEEVWGRTQTHGRPHRKMPTTAHRSSMTLDRAAD